MPQTERRRWIFTLIALTLPLVFFLALEGALRLTGFGEDYPLFVRFDGHPQYLQPNPRVIERFFANAAAAPEVSIDSGFFLADKPPGSLRIVVQGGSSAAGFPYGKHASPAGMLQQRLQRTFPNRPVEVIQTAMAAVNSYTLLDFADEIIAVQPDAVVIYAGHNEFVGVLGVGSALGAGHAVNMTRLMLSFRQWRVYQLMQRLVAVFQPAPQPRSGTLMAAVARERSIPLDSSLFARGVEQFRANLNALLARYASAGIPVFIGTLASNEKDQWPFIGDPIEADAGWEPQRDAVRQALTGSEAAVGSAKSLLTRYTDAADAWFLHGRAALAVNDASTARAAFDGAIDRDRLRFRAPTHFETVIRNAAARHGARVVETRRRLAAESAHAIIGAELMLEHLHPNANGYFLLADAFYDALANDGLGLAWRPIGEDQARAEQPLTRIERLHGEYKVTRLTNDWPFVEQKRDWQPPRARTEEQRIAQAWFSGQLQWVDAMNKALVHNQQSGDFDEAARIATSLADAFPFEAQPQFVAGQMLIRQTPPAGMRAIPYFHRAATLAPTELEYLITLTRAYWINGYRQQARAMARRLTEIAPGNPAGAELLALMERAASAERDQNNGN